MIQSFAHKGLRKFYEEDDRKGIVPQHATRLRLILDRLDVSALPSDMEVPGWGLHSLTGSKKNQRIRWSVKVNANWRVTFEMEDGDAFVVDYEDYH